MAQATKTRKSKNTKGFSQTEKDYLLGVLSTPYATEVLGEEEQREMLLVLMAEHSDRQGTARGRAWQLLELQRFEENEKLVMSYYDFLTAAEQEAVDYPGLPDIGNFSESWRYFMYCAIEHAFQIDNQARRAEQSKKGKKNKK